MASHYNLKRAAYSVDQLTDVIPLGRTKIYELLKQGHLPKRKWGKRTLIMVGDIEALLDKIAAGKAA